MLALGASRDSSLAWEYAFPFGGGAAPWVSGLAQGTGIQALTRGGALLREPRYLDAARSALGVFEAPPPLGVRVAAAGGSHYLISSATPGLRVLNGFLQALVGLHDLEAASGDARARRLFVAGDGAARRSLPAFDTGAWSRYSLGGGESDLGYHRLVRDFLRSLCERTRRGAYCATAARFDGYLHERARLDVPGPLRARAGAAVSVRVRLSKLSCVTVRLRRSGRVVRAVTLVLGGGAHRVRLGAAPPGSYTVEVQARDLMEHRTRVSRTLLITPARTGG
nr:hypothetical protein [Solirubrobacterales bacterium]